MQSKYDFPRYTYNDYKNWKEDWELINGYPINLLPSATIRHNKTQMRFIGQSLFSLQKNKDSCNCEVFAELDWKINEETVVRPDLMIICGETSDNYLEFPPVLIIEIISPSSVKKDRVIKFDLYREQGVKYYLMADYTKKTIEVFELIDNYYKQVERNTFLVDKNCEVVFDFDKIWE
jgi:Uma2 family endonuclease